MNPSLRRFLDVEAREEENIESDDDEDIDFEDNFIDDTDQVQHGAGEPSLSGVRRYYSNDDDDYDTLLARVSDRAHEYRKARDDVTMYPTQTEDIIRRPGVDDYPMWKVTCKIGSEEYILASLLSTAEPHHGLRSVIMRETLRGAIYLECRMNQELVRLLNNTLGIIRTRNGIRRSQLEFSEWIKLLTMKESQRNFIRKTWITISEGLYKGDVAFVTDVHTWGVDAYVLPRFSYRRKDEKGKRKATKIRPQADLFDATKLDESLSNRITWYPEKQEHVIDKFEFHYGLLRRTFNFSSLGAEATSIPWGSHTLFMLSGHPLITESPPPRPSEWSFAENDKVIVVSSKKKGSLLSFQNQHVVVDIISEGTHILPWNEIQRDFAVGDYVRITTGPHNGKSGWVTEVEDGIASVYIDGEEDKMNDSYKNKIESAVIHVNGAYPTDPPIQFAIESDSPFPLALRERYSRHAWCDTRVIISKLGHPRKGQKGTIINVLLGQPTATGIALVLRLEHFTPVSPYPIISIDCDYVVELTTRKPLIIFFKSKNDIIASAKYEQNQLVVDDVGSATPMPTETSSTPAWDPCSRTPMHFPSWDSPSQNSSSSQRPDSAIAPIPEHILLHPSFENLDLRVVANGGKYKNQSIVAKVEKTSGRLSLRHVSRGTSSFLDPKWIQPRHPSPTNYNGLVIVIEGEHHGKYLRRLFHEGYKASALMIGAVVERVDGQCDHFTGEEIKISANSLCAVEETQEEVNRMRDVMLNARHAYKKKMGP